MAALRDKEIQKNGIALIMYSLGDQKKFAMGRVTNFSKCLCFLPIRVVAIHACYDTQLKAKVYKGMANYLESSHLCRFRHHKGMCTILPITVLFCESVFVLTVY